MHMHKACTAKSAKRKYGEYKLELARKAGSATTQLVMMNGVLMSREEAADVQASR